MLSAREKMMNEEVYRTQAPDTKKISLKYKNFQAVDMMSSW